MMVCSGWLRVLRMVLITGCAGLCFSSAWAAELQPGVIYRGGDVVEVSQLGVALKVPEGWVGALPSGSELFVLEASNGKNMILVYAAQSSEAELRQTLSTVIHLDGYALQPIKALEKANGVWTGDYKIVPAANGVTVARVLAKNRGQTSVALIALDRTGDTFSARQAKAMVKQIKIQKVKPSPRQKAGANSWTEYMSGRYIARYVTRSGYTEETHLWLCSDGTFTYSDSSGGFGGGASGAYQKSHGGRWRAQGKLPGQGNLILESGSGQTYRFGLALENRKLYLDGNQWLRDSNQRCQ